MSKSLNVLGIYREEKNSNRAVQADKAILNEVLNNLRLRFDTSVNIVTLRPEIQNINSLECDFDLIFSMAQDESALLGLERYETRGAVVVNTSKGIRNCYRKKLSSILCSNSINYPKYVPVNIDSKFFKAFESDKGYWAKRGDFHSVWDNDVVYVEKIKDMELVLEQFKNRGIKEIILQENCEGELFKFYGVRNSFFNLRYMGKTTIDRYSFSPGNSNCVFDKKYLEKLVHKIASLLELDFFGGDCIITDSGEINFIDFNDWPSFRTCLPDAASKMTEYALQKLSGEQYHDHCLNK